MTKKPPRSRAQPSLNSLTIFRIRDGITDHEMIVRERGALSPFDIRIDNALVGIVYVRPPRSKPPTWLSYFQGQLALADLSLLVSSTAGVLIAIVDGCAYAVTFGYGRFLLAEQYIERRFGLKVLLNCVAPGQLRSLDHVRLDGIPRHTREQLSRAASVRSFGLDVERDILRGLVGSPVDTTLGQQLVGSDHLSVIGPPPLHELTGYLRRCEELSRALTYRTHFPWVDNMEHVTDSARKKTLDELLVQELQHGDLSNSWLAVPEVVDWNTIEGFQYTASATATLFDDLRLTDYFAERTPRLKVSATTLNSDGVLVRNAVTGQTTRLWSIYRCLNAELTLPDETVVLSDGKWYSIAKDFVAKVNDTIGSIPVSTLRLPLYGDDDEGAYNRRAADGSNGYLQCMDGSRLVALDETAVEPCDLYSGDHHLIHVKRYAGSSVLSHLFAQGVASAELLLGERQCRVQFNDLLSPKLKWASPVLPLEPSQFEIAYVVIDETARGLQLPLLSKITLRNAYRTLQGLQFKVSLTVVGTHKRGAGTGQATH